MHASTPAHSSDSRPMIEWRDARLHRHADYQRAYQSSRKQFSASMSWFFSLRMEQNPLGPARVGLTVGKVIGKAHERNRIKRRMRVAIRHHLATLPAGVDLILHPKRVVMTMDFSQLDAEVLRIFAQAADQTRNPTPKAAKKPFAVIGRVGRAAGEPLPTGQPSLRIKDRDSTDQKSERRS